jgi:hypothetical protein
MSSVAAKLIGFAVVLAALFGAGAAAGRVVDPQPRGADAPAHAGGEAGGAHDGAEGAHDGAEGAHDGAEGAHGADPVRGLAVAEHGLRLVVERAELVRGRTATLRFHVVDERGEAVRDFDVEHEKRMHLIVARRDLTGFQHVHPALAGDGTWSVPLRLGAAGSYRVFADFSHAGEATTLASDLRVDGSAELHALPSPRAVARAGAYDVRLDAAPSRPGAEAGLRFAISRGGRAVRPERFLGASGHLVALREGDLAFLHVHPGAGGFAATFPTAGRYRLFLQFKHGGRVRTAAFTREVR